mgnify:CR=1 FL=1
MLKGIGLDIVDVSRIKKAAEKWEKSFLQKVFTQAELSYCLGKKASYQSLAARFAAKEAAVKALGIGFQGVTWQDIEVTNDALGKPALILKGKALEIAEDQGVREMHLTLSHCKEYAVAQVIFL